MSSSSRDGPLETQYAILGRLGRFIFRNPSVKQGDHVIGYQSHVIWSHRAAVWADPIGLLIA